MEEKMFYSSTDDVKLCGVLNKVIDNKRIVILCHGSMSNKDRSIANLSNRLNEKEINTFRFDFRANGESSGVDKAITGQIEDLESTLDFLTNKGYDDFILMGGSAGGGIVSLLDYSKYHDIKGIILWFSALDYDVTLHDIWSEESRMDAEKLGFIERKNSKGEVYIFSIEMYKERDLYKPYENIEKLDLPILFVHGTKDESVPYELSVRVCKNCKNAKLVTIENGNHTFSDSETSIAMAANETALFIKSLGW